MCPAHFVSGRKAHYTDVYNTDWVLSINLNDDEMVSLCEVVTGENSSIVDADEFLDTDNDIECVDTIPNPIPPEANEIEFDLRTICEETANVDKIVKIFGSNFRFSKWT